MVFITETERKAECLGVGEMNSAPKTHSAHLHLLSHLPGPEPSALCLLNLTLIYFLPHPQSLSISWCFFLNLVINNRFPVTITFLWSHQKHVVALQSLLTSILLCLDQGKVPSKCAWTQWDLACVTQSGFLWRWPWALLSLGSNQTHLSPGFGFVHTTHDLDLGLCSLSSPLPVTILSFSKSQGNC